MLPPESTLFASVDVPAARGLLESLAGQAGLEDREVREILERTEQAYLGLSLGQRGTAGISLVALGGFRPVALELRLSFDRRWRKRTVGEGEAEAARRCELAAYGGPAEERFQPSPWQPERTYWDHPGHPFQLASPRPGVVLLSNESAARLLQRLGRSPGAPLPEDARRDLDSADLFLYFPALPAAEGVQELSSLPLRSLWLAARVDQADRGEYRVSAVFTLEGVSNERALERLFRLLIPLLLRRAQVEDPLSKLKALSLSVGPTRVRIDDLPLAANEVSGFLAGFLPGEDDGDAGGR